LDRFTFGGRSYELRQSFTDADFFATAGVHVIAGRAFSRDEGSREAQVALISDTVARVFFAGESPLGQSLSRVPSSGGRSQPDATIVGVVADAIMDGPESEVFGAIYRPLQHKLPQAFTDQGLVMPPSLLVRLSHDTGTWHEIEQQLQRVDAGVRCELTLV